MPWASVDRCRNGGEQVLQPALALAQLGLELLAIRNVARDLRSTDDPSRFVEHGRDRKRDVDETAVLAPADGLEVIDPLAAPDARKNLGLLAQPVMRDQDGDGPADDLLGLESEQPLRALIPSRDDPVEILADDGVFRGFHDRGKMPGRALGAKPFGDIAQISGKEHRAVLDA